MYSLHAALTTLLTLTSAAIDTSTLEGKFVVGYQGWFRSIGQDDGNSHWTVSSPNPSPGNVGVDFLPDVTNYPASCLFSTPFTLPSNSGNAQFYSSDCPGLVDYHYSLLSSSSLDGVFLQRFYGYISDTVGGWTNVLLATKAAAEKYGLGFAVEYDLTGADSSTSNITATLLGDLQALSGRGIFSSPAYFHHGGKPVVELWGFGIRTEISVEDARAATEAVKAAGYHVVLGVQQAWRSELGQASPPGYGSVYLLADTIQPWTVGSYDAGSYQGFYTGTQIPDLRELRGRGIDYGVVSWPGASSANSGNGAYDAYPRYNGSYYQAQLEAAVELKPLFMFTAMFDELNEGTAIMPTLKVSQLPTNQRFVGIDDDMDSGFYLTMAGNFSRAFKSAVGVSS